MSLGAALIYYAQETGLQLPTNASGVVVNDKIFPAVAFTLNKLTSIVFMIGLIAAGYSSADGTLTALTTTFCFDFLHFDKNDKITEEQKIRYRKLIHIGFAFLYLAWVGIAILALFPSVITAYIFYIFMIGV